MKDTQTITSKDFPRLLANKLFLRLEHSSATRAAVDVGFVKLQVFMVVDPIGVEGKQLLFS